MTFAPLGRPGPRLLAGERRGFGRVNVVTPDPALISAALALDCEPSDLVLLLRTCDPQRQGHGGFAWPDSGLVSAPDWNPRPICGYGLHGFLWGVGDGSLASWDSAAWWLVVAARHDELVELVGKVKVPRAYVVHASQDRYAATQYLCARLPPGTWPVIGATLTAGSGSTLTAGDDSTLTAGDGSTLTAGSGSTLTAGYRSTLTAGDGSTLTAGDRSTLTAGDGSPLTWRWGDGRRWRLTTVYTGEDGIEAGKPYTCSRGVVTPKI